MITHNIKRSKRLHMNPNKTPAVRACASTGTQCITLIYNISEEYKWCQRMNKVIMGV